MTYTTLVLAAVVVAVLLDVLLLRTRILLTKRYWLFMAIMSLLFFVVNGILTALPVVIYASHAITGLRLVTIPIEDAGYLFSLVTSTISIYERLSRGKTRRTAAHDHAH
jgi:lycopene cyclase domain-containing protein